MYVLKAQFETCQKCGNPSHYFAINLNFYKFNVFWERGGPSLMFGRTLPLTHTHTHTHTPTKAQTHTHTHNHTPHTPHTQWPADQLISGSHTFSSSQQIFLHNAQLTALPKDALSSTDYVALNCG
jgi:hypothetical protein